MTEEKTVSTSTTGKKQRSNRVVATACFTFFIAMIGAAYASVPLYRVFCQVTGYGGTTQRVEQMSDTILDKTINIRFDANTSGALPWDFKPKQREVTIRIGETKQISYEGRSLATAPTSGRASFNVTPDRAGAYFNKVQCFCFTDTTLQPGEDIDMPVVFFVDPDIVNDPDLEDLKTITLSYTFFPIDKPQPVAQSAKPADGESSGNL
ncbi:cytochrome c oxidase assembly protein [Phyllobacterium phragmitis]|uniref:Cytochrome c oxidase assembly protein CtaG n=1 Tax=Phyllobacterium phragmitis TaxID=2670329 RepID=A0A2S9IYV5_9HYPH|nr:cytochrome c oxidase assembly protein [Phyllobacterium phragmitis]PRD45716.1 cytochrome c oxidase assembly protein [Phyllobacterium phragmitis]